MCYNNTGAAPAAYILIHNLLCNRVKSTGGLVQHQYARVTYQRTGYLKPLPLSAGVVFSTLLHQAEVTTLPGYNLIMYTGILGCLDISKFISILTTPHGQVVPHCPFEQENILIHHSN